MIKAIETQYKGYRFRSRLEARWAVFFDALGIRWEYEKEGYDLGDAGWYLPDFWLPQVNMWAEVKGQLFTPQEINKCAALYEVTRHEVVMLDESPDYRSYFIVGEPPYGGVILMNAEGEISRETDGGYPGGDFTIPVPWSDVIVSNEYLDQHRFYANTGEQSWPNPCRWNRGDYHCTPQYNQAVNAARAARFEHGETPILVREVVRVYTPPTPVIKGMLLLVAKNGQSDLLEPHPCPVAHLSDGGAPMCRNGGLNMQHWHERRTDILLGNICKVCLKCAASRASKSA